VDTLVLLVVRCSPAASLFGADVVPGRLGLDHTTFGLLVGLLPAVGAVTWPCCAGAPGRLPQGRRASLP